VFLRSRQISVNVLLLPASTTYHSSLPTFTRAQARFSCTLTDVPEPTFQPYCVSTALTGRILGDFEALGIWRVLREMAWVGDGSTGESFSGKFCPDAGNGVRAEKFCVSRFDQMVDIGQWPGTCSYFGGIKSFASYYFFILLLVLR
jgi:hypothetical protein